MTASFRRPILFIYQVIALKYHLPSKEVFSKLYACARVARQALLAGRMRSTMPAEPIAETITGDSDCARSPALTNSPAR
jgi:hypothetical protein